MTETKVLKKQLAASPFKYYGENFDGHYKKISDIRDLITPFKEYYYEKKMANPDLTSRDIILSFNESIKPDTFFPYPEQFRRWRRIWDAEIIYKLEVAKMTMDSPAVIAVRTRDKDNKFVIPTDNELGDGARNLAGELMNDAMTMLKNDQGHEDLYEDEVIVKRRHYILNVFNYVIRAVNTKEALNIRKSQEKRETAGFLMDLVRRSTAGGISDNDMTLLKGSLNTKQDEQPAVADLN